jgi:NAD(P)-dependent dehydrogenase (short-subunit alcohol dehydrogenase family)
VRPIRYYHVISCLITYIDLKKDTGYESVELWVIDLAQISSVVDFAERFEKDGGRIDILLLNAGITPAPQQELTADGYEPVSVIRSYTE